MKNHWSSLLVLLLSLQSCASIAKTENNSIAAIKIIEETQNVLVDAASKLDQRGLKLSKVTLNLATVTGKEVKGGVKILFFGVDASKSDTLSNRISVTLAPPVDDTKSYDVSSGLSAENTRKLLDAILEFSDSLGALRSSDLPLEVTSLSGEIGFVVKKADSGELGFEFDPIDIGFGGGNSSSYEHKLTFVLTPS